MTTPAGYFRIRQTYGASGTDWVSPTGTTFPNLIMYGQVTYPHATSRDGLGRPRGAFGPPEMTLAFPPLTPTQRGQILTLFSYVPATQNYIPVEVENIDPRAATAPGWETWTGYIEKPGPGDGIRTLGAGLVLFGFTLTVTGMEAT